MHHALTDPTYLSNCRAALAKEQADSLAQTPAWAHVDRQQVHADWDRLYQSLVPLIKAEVLPSDDAVQSLMAQHFAIACRFYRPSASAYVGMGLFYQDNPGMRDFHNAYHPRMVGFLLDAMVEFAHRTL